MEAKKSPKADLESKKTFFTNIGLIISLSLMLFIFGWKTYDVKAIVIPNNNDPGIPPIVYTPPTIPKALPIPPPVHSPGIIEVDNKTKTGDVIVSAEVTATTVNGEPVALPKPPAEEPVKDEVVIVPDVLPEFPGGIAELYKYLYDRVKFSTAARELNISGTVYVTFVVEKDGSITDIRLLRGIGKILDDQVIKAVQEFPIWKPGIRGGKYVRVQFNLPVKFTLAD